MIWTNQRDDGDPAEKTREKRAWRKSHRRWSPSKKAFWQRTKVCRRSRKGSTPSARNLTELTRNGYREMLFTTEGLEQYISGVILFEETLRSKSKDGKPFPELLHDKGILPGIKVDKGTGRPARDQKRKGDPGTRRSSRVGWTNTISSARGSPNSARSSPSATPSPPRFASRPTPTPKHATAAICQSAGPGFLSWSPKVLMNGDHYHRTLRKSHRRHPGLPLL